MKTYRVGIIGFGHMHINNVAALFAQHPQVVMVACADTVPAKPELRVSPYTREWNKKYALTDLGVARGYDDYADMLSKEALDIVIVTSENARHADIVDACAAAGAHVCIEKPMAASLSDGLRMARACETAGTTLLVNWPLTWSPAVRKVKTLIDTGTIGRVFEIKWRAGHTGPLGPSAAHAGVSEIAEGVTGPERGATWWHQSAMGGGAMLDFCCYGAMVARWVFGEPAVAALGMKANLTSHWGDAEDNGVILVRFPQAMALLEGSWTTFDHGVPTGPIFYGTTGTLVVDQQDGEPVVRLERGHGQTTIYDCQPLPEGRVDVAQEYIHHLETGEALHSTLEMRLNLDIMAIMDAGIRSAASNKLEVVNNSTWCIG